MSNYTFKELSSISGSNNGDPGTNSQFNYKENTGMTISGDGTKFFLININTDKIYSFSLSTGFDFDTISFDGEDRVIDVSSAEGFPKFLNFSLDGSILYYGGNSSDTIYQNILASPYDVSRINKIDTIYIGSGSGYEFNRPSDFKFNDYDVNNTPGTRAYIIGRDLDVVMQLTLTTPYDMTTINNIDYRWFIGPHTNFHSGNNDNLGPSYETKPECLLFNPFGTKILFLGRGRKKIQSFTLSTPYDLSTVGTIGTSLEIPETIDNQPIKMVWNADGTKIFVLGRQKGRIITIDLASPYSIDSFDPFLQSIEINDKNTEVTVGFNIPVVTNSNGTGTLVASDFQLSLSNNSGGGTLSSTTPSSIRIIENSVTDGGNTLVSGILYVLGISITGDTTGSESLTVAAASSSSIFNRFGIALTTSSTVSANLKNITTPPVISSLEFSDATNLIVNFDEDVFNSDSGSGDLEASDFEFSLAQNGSPASLSSTTPASITKNSNSQYTLGLSVSGSSNGDEVLTVNPASATSIYNYSGSAASTSQSNNTINLINLLAPVFSSVALDSANTTLTVTFNEDVFNTNSGSGDLEVSDFVLSFTANAGNASLSSTTPSSITKNSGTEYVLGFTISGTPTGVEVITINPASNSIFDSGGNIALPSQGTTGQKTLNKKTLPTFIANSISSDNTTVTIEFSESVFNSNSGSGNLEISDFTLSNSGTDLNPTASSLNQISQTRYSFTLSLNAVPSDGQTLTVGLASSAVFDVAGNAASATQSLGTVQLNNTNAPVVSEITPVGTTSDTTPDLVIRSDKAGTISAVSTDIGILSGTESISANTNHTVTLQTNGGGNLSDGTYISKKIKITDSNSNVTQLNVSTFTITSAAPTLSEVTTIGTTTDTTPTFIINTDQGGTITTNISQGIKSINGLQGTNSIVVGNNTIEFNTLSDGSYTGKNVTVTNYVQPTSSSSVLSLTDFTIDTTGPSLSVVTPISDPSNVTTPTITIGSNETGTITATSISQGISSGSSISANNSNQITFNTLPEGSYTGKTITVQDTAGNSSNLTIPDFRIDTTAPTYNTSFTNFAGSQVDISFNDLSNLDSTSVPATSAFSVTEDGSAKSISSVSISGKIVTLNVATLSAGTAITFTYTKPGSGNTIKDLAGNEVASIGSQTVTNNVDTTKPTFSTTSNPISSFSGNSITITFTDTNDLNTTAPNTSSFSITEDGSAKTISSISISGKVVSISLSSNLSEGSTILLSYTKDGTNDIQDLAGNKIDNISNQSVSNITDTSAPVLNETSAIGTTNDQTPNLSFTSSDAGTITNISNSLSLSTSSSVSSGSNTVTFNTISAGSYSGVQITVTNNNSLATTLTLSDFTIDLTVPTFTNLSPSNSSNVNTSAVGYELNKNLASGTVKYERTSGTAASDQTVNLTGDELQSGVRSSAVLTNAPTLVSGTTYSIKFNGTDVAGNNAVEQTITGIAFDNIAPIFSLVTPINGSRVNNASIGYTLNESIVSNSNSKVTYTRTGGNSDGSSPHVKLLSGSELSSGTRSRAILTNDATSSLVSGTIYSISIDGVDANGNSASTKTISNITFDTEAPVFSNIDLSNNIIINDLKFGYTLNKDLSNGFISFNRTGGTSASDVSSILVGSELEEGTKASSVLTNPPALVSGAIYTINFDGGDIANNSASQVSFTNVTYDTTVESFFSNVTPTSNSRVKTNAVSYTLIKTISEGSVTFTRVGGSSDGSSPYVVNLSGDELKFGTQSLSSPPSLNSGTTYSITFIGKDSGNNTCATFVTSGIIFDSTAPSFTSISPSASSSVNTSSIGYTLSEELASGSVKFERTGGTSSSDITINLTGSELSSGAKSSALLTNAQALTNGSIYTLKFNGIDLAGNSATEVSVTGITFDTTNPVFSDINLTSNFILKTANIGYTLNKQIASGTVTFTRTGGTSASNQTVNLTGSELNSGTKSVSAFSNPPTLINGAIYTVTFNGTDSAGNSATTVSFTSVTYNTSAVDVFSSVTPSSNSFVNSTTISYSLSENLSSGTIKLIRTGGDSASDQTITLSGDNLSSGSRTSTGSFNNGTLYSISFNGTTTGSSTATTFISTNVSFDTTSPTITNILPISGSTISNSNIGYTLNENLQSAQVVFTRTSGNSDSSTHTISFTGSELNSGTRAISKLTNDSISLTNGTIYSAQFTITDKAGNQTSTTITNLTFGSNLISAFSDIEPTINSNVNTSAVGYTLSQSLTGGSGSITFTRTDGTADSNSPHNVSLTDDELNSGSRSYAALTNKPTLQSGSIYTISFNGTTQSGSIAETVNIPGISFNNTAPVFSSISPSNNTSINNTAVGYTLSKDLSDGTVTYTRTSGIEDDNSPHIVNLFETELNSGTRSLAELTNKPTLVNGSVYSISFNGNDVHGNGASTKTVYTMTFDNIAPIFSAINLNNNITLKNTNLGYTLSEAITSGNVKFERTGGTTDSNSPHVKSLSSSELNSGIKSVSALNNAPTLVNDSIYTISFNGTDSAGNDATEVSFTDITFNSTSPSVYSVSSPSSNSSISTGTVTYTLSENLSSGTISFISSEDSNSPHEITLSGTQLQSGSSRTATLSATPGLINQIVYSIKLIGVNSSSSTVQSVTIPGVTIDTVAPIFSGISPTSNTSINSALIGYTLSKKLNSGTIVFTRTSGESDSNSPHSKSLTGNELNSGTRSPALLTNSPTLVDGTTYQIAFSGTDDAGNNSSTVTISGVQFTTTPPAFTSGVTPSSNSKVKTAAVGYTLSKNIESGSVTFTRSGGTADSNSPHTCSLIGSELNSGTRSSALLTNSPTLVSGTTYSITFNATDSAGNNATEISVTNVIFDNTIPVFSNPLPNSNSNVNNTNIGFTLNETITSGSITFERTGGTADSYSPHVKSLTGSELLAGTRPYSSLTNSPTLVSNAIYKIKFNGQDEAGNSASELVVSDITYNTAVRDLFTLNSPSSESSIKADSTINYSLSDSLASGSIVFKIKSGSDSNSPHTISLSGSQLTSGSTSVSLPSSPTLVNGAIYDVSLNGVDSASNPATTVTITSLTYDSSSPTLSEVTQITNPTNDNTPSYTFSSNESGTLTETTITQGISSSSSIINGNNTITFKELPDGTYSGKTISVQDSAGNVGTLTLSTFEIDTTNPSFSQINPQSNSIVTNSNITYKLSEDIASGSIVYTETSGTSDSSSPHTVTLSSSQRQSDTSKSISNPVSLVNGVTYSITLSGTDAAGNSASQTITSVTVNSSASTVFSNVSPSSNSFVKTNAISYNLSENLNSGTVTLLNTGGSSDSTHTVTLTSSDRISGSSKTLTNPPTLVDGAIYSIVFSGTNSSDVNVASFTVTNVQFDTSLPVFSSITPTSNSIITTSSFSYTLSENISSGNVLFERTDAAASDIQITLSGSELNSGERTLSSPPSLTSGATYKITFTGIDSANNTGTTIITDVNFNNTAPNLFTNLSPSSGSTVNTSAVGYTLASSISSGTVTFERTSGSSDSSSPHVINLASSERSGTKSLSVLSNSSSLTLISGAIYSITFNGTTAGGISVASVTLSNITFDNTPPVFSGISPSSNSFLNSSSVGYTLSKALSSGTVTYTRTGGTYDTAHTVNLVNNELNSGTRSSAVLTNAPTLVSGAIYTIKFEGSDSTGNSATAVSTTGITFDNVQPAFTNLFPVSNSTVNTSSVGYTLSEDILSGTVSFIRTGGNADESSPHVISLTGTEKNSGTRSLSTLTNSSSLSLSSGSIYTIEFDARDAAGNIASTTSVTNIKFDTSSPNLFSNITPTSNSFIKNQQISFSLSETIVEGKVTFRRTSGTSDTNSPHEIFLASSELTGKSLGVLVNGTSMNLVSGAIYQIEFDGTNSVGNSILTSIVTNITFDNTVPVFNVNLPLSNSNVNSPAVGYTLSEDLASGTVTYTRTGGNTDLYSPHVVNLIGSEISQGTKNYGNLSSSPTLVSGTTYTISFNGTDNAGNSADTKSVTGIIFDTTNPVFSNVSPDSNSIVGSANIGYTLSEAILAGKVTFTRTSGTNDSNSPHTCTLTSTELNSGVKSLGALNNAPTLVSGTVYSITLDSTDLAGNDSSTFSISDVTFNSSAVSVFSSIAPATDAYVKSTNVTYSLSQNLTSGTIKFVNSGGTFDSNSPHSVSLTGSELNSGSHSDITLTNTPSTFLVDGSIYTISFNGTISSGVAETATSTNVNYDVTNPVFTNLKPIASSTINSSAVGYSLSEKLLSGTIVFLKTSGNDSTASHSVTLTGDELNSGTRSISTLTNAPTLVSGTTYQIHLSGTDLAGNQGSTISVSNINYNTSAESIYSSITPDSNSFIKTTAVGYTLSQTLSSGTVTFTRTGGTTDSSSPHTVNLTGSELSSGTRNLATLTNQPNLTSGTIYTITFNGVYNSNNVISVSKNDVTFDNTNPTLSSAVTNIYGSIVTLTFSEELLSSAVPPTSAFQIVSNSTYTTAMTSINIISNMVLITMTNNLLQVDTLNFTYNSSSLSDSQKLQDKAGNLVMNILTGAQTSITNNIDNTAPTLTMQTSIGTTNDTTPSITIHSSEDCTITGTNVSAGISSSTSINLGTNTITFNELEQGEYTGKTITVTDAGGNSTSLSLGTFTIDTTPPTLSEFTTISTPNGDNTPEFIINSSKDGTISTSLSAGIASGNSILTGYNTIVFNQLSDGEYSNQSVTVVDQAGNSTSLTLTTFTIDTAPPTLSEQTPVSTPTNDSTPNYVFFTNSTGSVTTSISKGISSGSNISSIGNHTITFNQLDDGTYTNETISVTDTAGNTNSLTMTTFIIDTAKPTLSSSSTNLSGSQINLTFNENLNETAPNKSAFSVTVGGSSKSIDSVSIDDSIVTLNLSSSNHIAEGDSAVFTYTKPGSNDVKDLAGNLADSIPSTSITNIVDTTVPSFSSGTSNETGRKILITFTDVNNLDDSSIPSTTAFIVDQNGTKTVNSVSISGKILTLNFSEAEELAENLPITFKYTKPGSGNVLKDIGNNEVATISTAQSITNIVDRTPPLMSSGTTNSSGNQITLTFNSNIQNTPPASSFTIKASGNIFTITNLTLSGSTIVFGLLGSIAKYQYIRVSYTKPETNKIQDEVGNDLESFTDEIVTNASTVFSNICFIAGTEVNTDQGIVKIEEINPEIHTIKNKKITHVTCTISHDDKIILIKKNALGKNKPNKKLILSGFHKIKHNKIVYDAYKLAYLYENVKIIDYNQEPLYNIMMENWEFIKIHNLKVETLHPDNIIAKLYRTKLSESKKIEIIKEINKATIEENKEKYLLIKNHIL